jgi:molybdopterin molybdotransferase
MSPTELVLSFEDARHAVEQHGSAIEARGTETVQLLEGLHRVLAEQVTADRDFPPFPRSTRDGYAVRSADVTNVPATLNIVGEIKAGVSPAASLEVGVGQAAAIMTGAPAPRGSNAVVMVEHTSRADDKVTVLSPVNSGENIVPTGTEARREEPLLLPGTRVNYARIAIAASVGKAELAVYRRPRVAILSTGDELVDIHVRPDSCQIRNSNTYSLAAQVMATGGEPLLLPIAPDEAAKLRELIVKGLEADLLLITGGVSMGKYDLVEQVLQELKAEFFFAGAKIQPGKPVVFGRVSGKYFFGLPGNPVSTMVTFELFVRPLVEALAGMSPRKLTFLHARLKTEIRTRTGLKRFLPALLSGEFQNAEVELARWQGSGDITATARANCFLVIPPDRERIAAGEWVAVLPQ